MGIHERIGQTDEWYTPPHIFDAMGVDFDLDVAHPGLPAASWVPARRLITRDSLTADWEGFVWMNPPFGGRNGIVPWMDKFFDHGDGVALSPDRTSAPWWQAAAKRSDAILFISPKIKFIGANGEPGRSPAQGTTLFAAGDNGLLALGMAANNGLGLLLRR